jgi:hypothetical protein
MNVLTAHFKALVAAGSDENVLRQYSALLRFLKSRGTNFLESPPRARHRTDLSPRLATFGAMPVKALSSARGARPRINSLGIGYEDRTASDSGLQVRS